MRIIHVVPFYLPATRYGGPIYSVHGLCKALARQGHDVHVFTTNMDGAGESDVPVETPVAIDGVYVHYYRATRLRRLAWTPRMLLGLSKLLDEQAAQTVLHMHLLFTFPTTAVAQLARVRGVPYVISPRGVLVRELLRRKSYWVKTFWLRAFDARSLAGAARIHVTSDTELRELSAFGLRIAATILAPNGVDTPPVLAADGGMLELSEPYGLFLGRISWKKGLDRALRALVHTQARLLIVGGDDEGLQPALEREALQLGVTERIEFLGQRDGAQKWQLLRNARFLILPSYNENFGNVVAEAMAVRCPVIVTPEVGAAEIVRRAGAGIVAEGDAATLGAAMERLWTRGEDREQFGFAGAEYVREHLSWDAIARVFAQEYAEILRASGR